MSTTVESLTAAEHGTRAEAELASEVTERQREQDSLRENEDLFRTIIEASPVALAVNDEQQNITYLNRRFIETFGYTLDDIPTTAAWWPLAYPDPFYRQQAIDEWQEALAKAQRDGTDVEVSDLKVRCKDGLVRDVHFGVTPIGKSHLVVLHDITEKVRTEETLRRKSEELDRYFILSLDLLCIADLEGRLIRVNPQWELALGYSRSELEGRFLIDFVHPDDVENTRAAISQLAAQQPVINFQNRYRCRDGSYRWFEWRSVPQGDLTYAAARDVSIRKLAEDSALRAARDWQTTFDSSNDAIWILSADQRILRSNKTAERFFERPASEMIGKHCWAIVHHGVDPHPECPFVRARLSKKRETMRLKEGAHWFEVSVDPILDDTGQVTGAVHVVSDISARVSDEKDRARIEEQLHRTERLDALGTLAGGIAHDFNNILGAILGNTELASQDVGIEHPAIVSLGEIRKASLRAKDLVHRILEFASQHQEPQHVIGLRSVVEEAVALLRSTIPAIVEITATFGDDAPVVLTDATQIHQLLINLCTNSWHAMEGGKGRIDVHLDGLTLGAEATRINPELSPGRFARLRVVDTGVGMDTATIAHIFEPFFTTKSSGHGTGLGLSVVHGIVKAHRGAIEVTSKPGQGTTFTVYFPAAEEPEQGNMTCDEQEQPLAEVGGRHVLYLDDEESLVFLATRMLERQGYRVSGYTRAEEAVAAVRADPAKFDMVVTDFSMPAVSGLDVARQIAALRADLPVVLASGYVTDELRAHALDAGVREVIYKPNTVEELCTVVRRVLDEDETR